MNLNSEMNSENENYNRNGQESDKQKKTSDVQDSENQHGIKQKAINQQGKSVSQFQQNFSSSSTKLHIIGQNQMLSGQLYGQRKAICSNAYRKAFKSLDIFLKNTSLIITICKLNAHYNVNKE